MHISFNSIDELNAFLNWADDYSGSQNVTVRVPASAAMALGAASIRARTVAGDVAFDTPPAAETASTAPPPDDAKPSVNPEPVKRKRRTKAEIEADEAEAAIARAAAAAKAQEPTTEATETAPAASTAPEGTNPFAAAEPAAETPATPAAEPDAADTTVTPFQHLTRAREFIAKHGMPKYNESFAKAGLDANVMGYSAYQRALHMDALAALEAA